MKVVAIVPALREAATIGDVVAAVGRHVAVVVVVDGASGDGTAKHAAAAGAVVVVEARRGYGRACMAGVARARELGADLIAFVDGGGAEDPDDLPAVLGPLRADRADLVVGSRVRGAREPGALRPLQRLGNGLATAVLARRHGRRFSDLGSLRAIGAEALAGLGMKETGSGWPLEMQARALARGLRVEEVPIAYRRRQGGESKVSGSPLGSLRAGLTMLRVLARGAR